MVELGIKGHQETIVSEAYDERGLIGEGILERFIIDVARFISKTEGK